MSEEYGNDFVTLIDEDGNEVEFEHIDTVEYEGRGGRHHAGRNRREWRRAA